MMRVALSIGSNMGCREFYIAAMEQELSAVLADARSSAIMETEPVGVDEEQPPYLNKVIIGYYPDTPYRLLDACLAIESRLGRVREKPKSARTADVDILIFGDMALNSEALVIPHPQMFSRRFCLEGLAQACPQIAVPGPGGGRTALDLYKNMDAEVAAQNVFWV